MYRILRGTFSALACTNADSSLSRVICSLCDYDHVFCLLLQIIFATTSSTICPVSFRLVHNESSIIWQKTKQVRSSWQVRPSRRQARSSSQIRPYWQSTSSYLSTYSSTPKDHSAHSCSHFFSQLRAHFCIVIPLLTSVVVQLVLHTSLFADSSVQSILCILASFLHSILNILVHTRH